MRGRIWLVAAIVTAVSAATGAALGATGSVDLVDDWHQVAAAEVPYHTCPDDLAVGVFHAGDRVWATGRDDPAAWIAVRSPQDLQTQVWVKAAVLDPDGDLQGLPVVDCAGVVVPTTVPESVPSTVPGTQGLPTTAAAPSTTAPPLAPTSPPLDAQPPTIGAMTSEPGQVWEDGASCVRLPRAATVSVTATDASGVEQVTLSWSAGSASGSTAMAPAGGETWSTTVGPFAPGSVGGSSAVTLTVSATDSAGNSGSSDDASLLTLEPCS